MSIKGLVFVLILASIIDQPSLASAQQLGKETDKGTTFVPESSGPKTHTRKPTSGRRREPVRRSRADSYNESGHALTDQGNYSKAEAAYKNAIAINPNKANYHRNLGNVQSKLKKYSDAEAAYKNAVAINPHDWWYHSELGDVQYLQKKYPEAEAAYRKAIVLKPSYLVYYHKLVIALSKQNKYREAEAVFKEVLRVCPTSSYILNGYGYFLVERNERLTEALEMIKQAVTAKPNNLYYLGSLGWAYFKLGRLEEAERYLSQAANGGTGSSEIQEHLGDLYDKRYKKDLAVKAWQKALEFTSDADETARLKAKINGITVINQTK